MVSAVAERGVRVREPLWTRNFVLTLASMHLFFLAWSATFSTLPLYVEDAPKWQVGWVVAGAVGVASFATRLFSGRVIDRTGRRTWMVAGAVGAGVFMAATALTSSPLALTPIRLLFGIGSVFYTTAGMAMLADVLPVTRRGEGMGWYGVVYTTTNVYAPWLGLTIADTLGLPVFFVLNGAVLIACAAVSALIREERQPVPIGRPAGALLNRSALLPTTSFMSLAITFSALPAFLVLYARQRDLGNAGIFFFVLGLALVATRWFGGAAADRFGRAAVIVPGFIITAVSMLLLALAPGPAVFYASAIVFGIGFGLGHTGLTILTVDRAAPEERGAAMATFSLAWDVGTLGAFALGFVADALSLRALFAVAALLPLVALVGFVSAVRRGRV